MPRKIRMHGRGWARGAARALRRSVEEGAPPVPQLGKQGLDAVPRTGGGGAEVALDDCHGGEGGDAWGWQGGRLRARKARWRGECGGEEKAAAQCTEAEGWAYQAGTRALGRLAGLLGKCGSGGTASASERFQLAH